MKFLWHLFSTDVRRLRALLALWVVVVAAVSVITAVRPFFAANAQVRESLAVIAVLVSVSHVLLAIILVPLVIQAHPAVGTKAFWMTRPIPVASLVLSKLLLIALAMIVVSASAEIVVIGMHGFPVETIAGVVGQGSLITALLILLLAVAAVLTSNLARFFVLCGAAVGVLAVTLAVVVAIEMRGYDSSSVMIGSGDFEMDPTGDFVFIWLMVFVLILMLATQYITRRRTLTIVAGVLAVQVVHGISIVWPWPFLKPLLLVPPAAQQAIRVAIDESTIATHRDLALFPEQRTEWSTIRGRVIVEGVAPGWAAGFSVREATLQLNTGATLRSTGGPTAMLMGGDYLHPGPVLREVLGAEVRSPYRLELQRPPDPSEWPVLFRMRQPDLASHVPSTGEYVARATISFTNFAIEAVLPIEAGARYQGRTYRLALDRVDRSNRHVSVVAREARTQSLWDKRPWSMYTFYLRNRTRQEAMPVDDYGTSGDFAVSLIPGLHIGFPGAEPFVTRGFVFSVPPPGVSPTEMSNIDAEWLAGAELVIVRRTDEGSISRDLRVSQFPLGEVRAENRP